MIALAIAIAVGAVAVWKLRFGIFATILLWPGYLLRTSIAGIPTTALELSIYALALAVVLRLITKKMPWGWVRMSRFTWILLGTWALAWILSTATAIDREAALGALKAWFLDPLLFVAILSICVRTPEDRAWVVTACLTSGTVVALAGLIQLIGFRDTLEAGRLSSFFAPVANYAAMYLGPLIVLNLGWLLFSTRTNFAWGTLAIMSLGLAATLSFGGYLAVGVGALYLIWNIENKKLRKNILLGGVIAVVIIVGGLTQTKNFSQHFDLAHRSSGSAREQIWVTSWAIIQQHPWFGIGPNTFEPAYRAELPHHYFPPLEWLVAQPHNLYLALWLETGLLGLVTFLTLFFYHLIVARKEFLPNPKQRAITLASLAAMIAILVHGFVDTPYFKNDLSVLFLTIAILPWLDRQKTE